MTMKIRKIKDEGENDWARHGGKNHVLAAAGRRAC